mgnify:CR=1 FL=1|jgi:hypothetical protein
MSKSILEKAQEHFAVIHDAELNSYYVEQWKDTIYFRSTMTWKEQAVILDATSTGSTSDALIQTVMLRSLDKNGDKLFSKIDKVVLENDVDPAVIVDIVGAINRGSSALTEEEAEKK